MDVDIVLLWVDGNDHVWLDEYNKYCIDANKKDNSKNRFRDWDNLQYLFRGVDSFLPWIRKIHFVTFGHVPKWLNIHDEKIKIHKHTDIFKDTSKLPVFNASAIELNINNIEGLAENFIYFNDDFFILKDLPITRFFKDGKPVDFLVEEPSRDSWLYNLLRNKNVWTSMVNNSLREINTHFSKRELLLKNRTLFFNKRYGMQDNLKNLTFSYRKKFNGFAHYHLPQPYCKRTLVYAEKHFMDIINATSGSRFRHKDNISQALFRYIHLARGDFYPEKNSDFAVFSISDRASLELLANDIKRYNMVCINDELETDIDFDFMHDELISILNDILPKKCRFEI